MEHSLLYCMVASGKIPLANFSTQLGTFKAFSQELLSVVDPSFPKCSYKYNEFTIHMVISEGFTYLCITHQRFPTRTAYAFLQEVKLQFLNDYKSSLEEMARERRQPMRFEMNEDFKDFLESTTKRYSEAIKDDVDIGVEVMDGDLANDKQVQTIDLDPIVLRRKIKIPLLSQVSEYTSRKAKKHVKKERLAAWLLAHPYVSIGFCIFVGVLILLYFVVVVPICGSQLNKKNAQGKRICWFNN
mmetsp:Transcript_5305/g.5773  ORF Transcript_5305/g.5773 Transcript_5305/m.5773 type:complete len:243 (+) Transcript_5305:25-753(+)